MAIDKKHLEAKSEHLSKASAILGALRDCLDFKVGGEVTENLFSLYSYMIERLIDASIHNDVKIVDEVSNLLKEIKSAWDAIPVEIRNQTFAENSAHAMLS